MGAEPSSRGPTVQRHVLRSRRPRGGAEVLESDEADLDQVHQAIEVIVGRRNSRDHRFRDEHKVAVNDECRVLAPGRNEVFPVIIVFPIPQLGFFDVGARRSQHVLRQLRAPRVQRNAREG